MSMLIEQDLYMLDLLNDSVFFSPNIDVLATMPEPVYEIDVNANNVLPYQLAEQSHQEVAEPSQPSFHTLQPAAFHQVQEVAVPSLHQPWLPGPSSGIRQTTVPPRQHNFFSPDDSDVMVDEFGMPIATRTRSSVSSSVSSFSSSVASHQKRCDRCGKIYTRNYFKKHKCLPK